MRSKHTLQTPGVILITLCNVLLLVVLVPKLSGCEEQTPADAVGQCYVYEDDEQRKYEACICRVVDRYGCRTTLKATPKPHRDAVLACCEGDERGTAGE